MLKVGSPQPPMDAMPPMNEPPMMGGDPDMGMSPMGDNGMTAGNPSMDMPPMGDDSDSEFDTNFDAGVDADENSDPKKYIQQLTGKLSQSLRKYNSELPQPEADLCKYVAGMILKQTTEGLTDGDKKDIIDKVNEGGSNASKDDGMGDDMPPMDDQEMGGDDGMDMPQPMAESRNHRSLVNEIFQELIQGDRNTNYDIAPRKIKDVSFRKKPFTAPNLY